ncbi:MAG: DinB family protein [Longimicrobiales bacterium]
MEIRTIRPFLEYYEGIRARTRRVIDCTPPERLEWTHAPGRFTFGDLIRHLAAIERFMFAENVRGLPSRYPGHGQELAKGWDDVIVYFEERHREAMELFATLTDEDLTRKCTTPGGGAISVWKWLRAMVEHEVHHRGQIYLMLGMIGVPTPPLYGLTEEQVKARSIP